MAAARPAAPSASVVIVNWNGRRYLEPCLASLVSQTLPPLEIIVVDNGSTDGSREWLAAQHPAVRLIANEHNVGFAAANNQGIRVASGTYVALLNNDAWAEPGWLAALVAAAEAAPQVGSVASLMVFAGQPDVVNSAGICVDRFGVTWDRAGGEAAANQGTHIEPVFGASAGAALYRRTMLQDLGGLNEAYFIYLEDVDLAWRARWLGWQAVLAPDARVHHVHSGTTRQGSDFKTYLLARNKLQMLLTNYPWPHLLLVAPFIVLYDVFSLANSLFGQRSLSGLRGRLAGVSAAGQALRIRRQIQAARRVAPHEVFDCLAPPDWPWRIPRRYAHLDPAAARATGSTQR